jgi:predicted MPP superfamily phosphohydrolase
MNEDGQNHRATKPRKGSRALALVIAASLAFLAAGAIGYGNALAPPIERHLSLGTGPDPRLRRPLKLILFSDVHVHGPDMPPERLQRIVAQINNEHADIVVAAGDFIGDNWVGADYPIDEAVAPLAALRSRLGVFAVLGNNDHIAGRRSTVEALSAVHVRVLNNEAVSVGPIVLGGVDYRLDRPRSKALEALYATLASMEAKRGVKVLVAHSPDVFPSVPPFVSLVLAGHTHCGQIALPLVGPLLTGSRYGRQFVCGHYREGNHVLLVTAGLGTSHIPIRVEAPPDFWVIEIHE